MREREGGREEGKRERGRKREQRRREGGGREGGREERGKNTVNEPLSLHCTIYVEMIWVRLHRNEIKGMYIAKAEIQSNSTLPKPI